MLALTAARLCLRLLTAAPKPPLLAPWLLMAAKAMHVSLYAVLLLLPLSGWLMATTTPIIPTSVFGLFTLPYPLEPDQAVYRFAHVVHVAAATAIAALVALHAAAALIHALWLRDRVLALMWSG